MPSISILLQFLVGLLILPLAVPIGVILVLYAFYPTELINVFIKFGGFIAAPGFDIKSLKINGINISYMDRPAKDDRQPTLVFVHGFTNQKISWIPLLRQLPSTWRIVAFDLPGHGESGFSEDCTYVLDTLADLMHELVVALDLKNFHIVGESMGALCAIYYASTYPERITSRIIMCPPHVHVLGAKHTPTTDYLFGQRIEGQKNPFLPTSPTEFQKLLDLVLYQPKRFSLPKHLVKAILKVHMKHYPYFEKISNDIVSTKVNGEQIISMVTSNRTPLLILWGQNDQVFDVTSADILKKIAPWSEVVIINDCGHAISIEKIEKCAHLIEEFIK